MKNWRQFVKKTAPLKDRKPEEFELLFTSSSEGAS